jgi:hypothetical protein
LGKEENKIYLLLPPNVHTFPEERRWKPWSHKQDETKREEKYGEVKYEEFGVIKPCVF